MDTNIIRDEGPLHEDSRLVSFKEDKLIPYSSLREDPDVEFDIKIAEKPLGYCAERVEKARREGDIDYLRRNSAIWHRPYQSKLFQRTFNGRQIS